MARPAKEVIPIKVGKVTLQGGNIAITDNFIKPNYSANPRPRSAAASTGFRRARVRLPISNCAVATTAWRREHHRQAQPFAAKSYLDLDAEVKGVEMTGFSTYSGRYAGYAIERGKLSLFPHFTRSTTTSSPPTTASSSTSSLSATPSIALRRHGCRCGSPSRCCRTVAGRDRHQPADLRLADDPQFSVGGIIVQVILNVFYEGDHLPFALIGSLFGGGEELSYVEFDYGYSTISAKMKERLQTDRQGAGGPPGDPYRARRPHRSRA